MLTVTIILTVVAAVFAALSFLVPPAQSPVARYIAAGVQATALLALALACIAVVPASNTGVQVRLGEVLPETLAEGPHLVPPWAM
jgi:regulator of protease activity HflC (stomatin/prohibitin superfamily)